MDRGCDDVPLGVDIDSPAGLSGALRQLRRRHARQHGDTELTYRELAAKTGYAHGVIGDYFTGKVLPPTDRLDVLVVLLGATGEEQNALATARDQIEERRRRPAVLADATRVRVRDGEAPVRATQISGTAAATRTLPHDIASFTGREPELRELESAALAGGATGIHVVGGMAGIGKTAFAVHAAHRLAARFPDGQIFLALHGHTPGQRPVDPADALASLLLTAGASAAQIPPGLEPRAGMWRDYLAGKRLLLLLDDAAGHEQVRPLLPGTPGSLVLATSRRNLTALEDAHAICLDTLSPGEAAELLIRLAARPGLRPGDPAVGHVTRLCGYLPLAVGMLARQLHHHPAWTAASLAADLAAAHDHRLELMHAENVSVAAAFDLSYQDLAPGQQRLFRYLGLHPGTDIDAYAAAALCGTNLATARRQLEALYDQHLLAEHAHGRYRFHDLIREHARTLAAADPAAERDAVTDRILDYYLHTTCTASRHVARRDPAISVAPPAAVPDLPDRKSAVAWLDAERLNVHAAVDHAAASGRAGHATAISAAIHGYLCSHGHWDQAIALHRTALDAARQAHDQPAAASALTGLGIVQRLTGDIASAIASFTGALDLCRDAADQAGKAAALNELGVAQYLAGDPAAAASLSQALAVFRDTGDLSGEAVALNDLSIVQLATGDFQEAADGLSRALELHRSLGDRLWEANALNNRGVVQRLTGDSPAAAASHAQALDLYRDLGNQFGEANALNYAAIVQCLTGDYPAAAAGHAQALKLYRELGNRLGEAAALNSMGEAERAATRPAQAAPRHEQALAIAVAIGSPMEEARALEGIGRCHLDGAHLDGAQLAEGQLAGGAERLRQALSIYQRIRSPNADRVTAILQDHGL